MGLAATGKLLEEKWAVEVFDVFQGALERAKEAGAETVATPQELAGNCEVALMFLPGPAQVTDCVTGPQGLLAGAKPGLIIVDMSTVDPGTTEAMASAAQALEVHYLDAPVLGRPAAIGAWALPVGGDAQALDKCRPVLSTLAKNIMHVGPVGTGNKIKFVESNDVRRHQRHDRGDDGRSRYDGHPSQKIV